MIPAGSDRGRSSTIHGGDGCAIVLSAGGEPAILWQTGVLAGLADSGHDPRVARVVTGTSTGSIVASRLASGRDPRQDARELATLHAFALDELQPFSGAVDHLREVVDDDRDEQGRALRAGAFAFDRQALALPAAGHVARQSARLLDDSWPEALRLVALDADSGDRVVLDRSARVSLPAAVGAASAVPGVVQPVELGGRRLIDAGAWSGTNADLLPDGVGRAIVVMATESVAASGSIDTIWNEALALERARLDLRRVDTLVVHLSEPSRAAMGDDRTSTAHPQDVVACGRMQGREVGATLRG